MAIATSSNFYQNAIVGQPQAGADFNVLDRHTSPKQSIGLGFTRGDGNKFRYVHYGAAVVAGAVVGCSNTNNNFFSADAKVVAPATAQTIAGETITAGSAGSRYVEIILTTVAANQFAGGYLAITKDTGLGYTYRIRGNTASGNPTSGNFRCELYEPLKVALDNTSDIAITPSVYVDLDEAPAIGTSYSIAGVSMAAVSADNWGWVCTHGPVAVLTSDTGVRGGLVSLTNGTSAGQVRSIFPTVDNAMQTVANNVGALYHSPIIGYTIVPAGAAGQHSIVYVTLE